MQTLYSPNELAERWGLTPTTIRQMERDGKLHRLPDMPGVKYSAAEVYQLESLGRDAAAMSAWERKQLTEEAAYWKKKYEALQERFIQAQQVLQGGIT